MSYLFVDTNGFLAHGPTAMGWRDAVPVLTGPAGRELAREGMTVSPRDLVRELDAAEVTASVRDVVGGLRRAAERAEGVLVVTDGSGVSWSR